MARRIFILSTLYLSFFITLARAQQISLSVQTGHSSTINKIVFSPDGRVLASAGRENSYVLWDVNTSRQLSTVNVHSQRVNDIVFVPNTTVIASVAEDGLLVLWDYEKEVIAAQRKFDFAVKAVAVSKDGQKLAVAGSKLVLTTPALADVKIVGNSASEEFTTLSFSFSNKFLAAGGPSEKSILMLDVNTGAVYKKYPFKATQLMFAENDAYLAASGLKGRLKRWRLDKAGLFASVSMTAERIWQSYNAVAISDHYFVGGNRNNLISIFDIHTGRKLQVLNGHDGDVNALAITPDGKLLASTGEEKRIVFWDLSNYHIVKVLQGVANKINDFDFTGQGRSIVIGYADGSFRHWDMTPGGAMINNRLEPNKTQRLLRWEYTISDVVSINESEVELLAHRIKSKKRDNHLYKSKGMMVRWNTATNVFSIRKSSKDRTTTLAALLNPANLKDSDGSVSAEVTPEDNLAIRDAASTVVISEHGHADRVTAVRVNAQEGIVATAGFDGLIRLHDIKNGKALASAMASGESDYIFVTPGNYYFSTKGALGHIGFRIGSRIFSFEQFDIKFNRPDLVLTAIKHPDTIAAYVYYQAYQKRLQKNNASLDDITSFANIPEVLIVERPNAQTSASRKYSFTVEATDKNAGAGKLFVNVNGVPAYPRGLPIEMNMRKEVIIDLSYGSNKVMYYVTNEKGNASLKHSFVVSYKEQEAKSDLYIVTIGASKYRKTQFNLKYAAKDATDIENLFYRAGKFREVKKISLLNENVTKENFKALAHFVSGATVDDMVLISYAGHGLLDKNLDYFLSTYDIDFENPAVRGIAFSEVELLLENVKSRNKVLMIDACHSGEIDKEEVDITAAAPSQSTDNGNITFRTVGTGIRNKSGVGLKSSFELSKAIFADTESTHGAVVISSAGGAEYAIEGTEWNNGIFTYCLINGLRTKKSDLDKNGEVSVLELQRFLGMEVPRLTNGRQTPTSREENLNNNFVIW